MNENFEVAYLEQADEFIGSLDIWEFRTLYQGLCYRLFAFWDDKKKKLVICTHGIIKKSQKTPKTQIDKAERIRNEYFNTK